MPETFHPRPYQEEAIQWLLDRPAAALFASPGTGKTAITFTAIEDLILSGECRGALIVGPIRVGALTYPNQIARWKHLRWMRYHNLRTPEGMAAWERGSGELFFINFELLATRKGAKKKGFVERCIKGRKDLPVDILVVDESSKLKDPQSKAARTLIPFLHDIPGRYESPFKRRYVLTGTPAAESYLALWNQIRILDNGERLGRSFWRFRQSMFESDFMGFKWTIRPGAKEQIDEKIADLALVIRGEDHLDLPPMNVEDIDVTLPPAVMRQYRELEKEMLVRLGTGQIEAMSAATLVNKLAQFTSGLGVYDSEKRAHFVHDAKVKALRKLLKECAGEPVLVMVHYVSTKERLLKEFPEAVAFDEALVPDWQAGKIPAFIANAQSMAHGLDGLQTARRICWYDLTYSAELFQQANARVYRMGQERPTLITRLLAADTVDWAIAEALRAKDEQQQGLFSAVKALQQLRKSN